VGQAIAVACRSAEGRLTLLCDRRQPGYHE
jgi:hypothetical protein